MRGATKTGLVSLAETLPFLIFGLVAGAFVDRSRRIRLMIGADLGRALALLMVPVLFLAGTLNWVGLAGIAFFMGTMSALFNPARDSIIPDIGEGVDLIRVNSIFQTSVTAALVVGTGLAAAFLQLANGGNSIPRLVLLLGIDGVTFLVSAIFLGFLKLPLSIRAPQQIKYGSTLDDTKEGLVYALKNPLLLGLLFITAVDNLFIMGPATVGAALFIRSTLKMGPQALALYECAFSAAYLLVALALYKWGSSIPKGKMVIFGIILDGLTYIPFFWVRTYPMLLLAIFIHAISVPLIVVGRTAIIQQEIPKSRLGKVFSLMNLTVFGFWALSGVLTGWGGDQLADLLGSHMAPPVLFLISGIGGTLCGLLALNFRKLRLVQ